MFGKRNCCQRVSDELTQNIMYDLNLDIPLGLIIRKRESMSSSISTNTTTKNPMLMKLICLVSIKDIFLMAQLKAMNGGEITASRRLKNKTRTNKRTFYY